MVSVVDWGAKGDGVTDDRAAVAAALAAVAKAGGGIVVFPPGIYMLGREGRAPYSIDLPCDNCTLLGVKGRSWLRHPKGLPGESVSLVRIDQKSHVTIRDLGFDGNWGNTVGGMDGIAGLNQGNQGDPKNHLLMLRGVTDVSIESTGFRQAYGDCVWIGASTKNMGQPSSNVRITDVDCDMAARDGIALGQAARGIHVDRSRFTNIFAQAFDTEPVNQGVEDVTIENSELGGWWNPANPKRGLNSPLSIVGGNPNAGPSLAARHYRVHNNIIHGTVLIASASDVVLDGNQIVTDWEGFSYSPVTVRQFADDITIANNNIYDQTHFMNGSPTAGIAVTYYAAGKTTWSPANVRVVGNQIHARNGNSGIVVDGAGAHGGPPEAGTASAVTATSLTDTSKTWVPGAWTGATVHLGDATAMVGANTATTLQLIGVTFGTASGWMTPTGTATATPAPGAYTIGWINGTIDLADNTIDLGDQGTKPNGAGIVVVASRPGGRVRIHGNTIKNAGGSAIRVKFWDKWRSIDLLEIADNHAFDDQPVHTTKSVVQFDSQVFATQLMMRGNAAGVGVEAAISGIMPAWWIVELGATPRYAGPGTPEGKVSAPVGAVYQRVDAAGPPALYVKASGGGNVGWGTIGPGSTALSPPSWLGERGLVGASWDPALPMTGLATVPAGQVALIKVRAYGAKISTVLVDVDQAPTQVRSVYVGLYRADGTQTEDMKRATTDAVAAFTTSGVKQIALAAPTAVIAGDDLYVAILPVGPGKRTLRLRGAEPNRVLAGLDAINASYRAGACCEKATSLPAMALPTTPLSPIPWIGLR